jgi:hypothetical protein
MKRIFSRVAQLVARVAHNHEVAGSSPVSALIASTHRLEVLRSRTLGAAIGQRPHFLRLGKLLAASHPHWRLQ